MDKKSSQPLQFNTINVLPSSKIPYNKIPLDIFISNKLNFVKKNAKFLKAQVGEDIKKSMHQPMHKRDAEAIEAGLTLIDEFQFPHVVFSL